MGFYGRTVLTRRRKHVALVRAANDGDACAVQALIEAGADPNADVTGSRAIMFAGNTETLHVMLRHGGRLDYLHIGGSTILHIAEHFHRWDVVYELLKLGCHPTDHLRNRPSPLKHLVSYKGIPPLVHVGCIVGLLEAGADPKDIGSEDGLPKAAYMAYISKLPSAIACVILSFMR